MYFIIFYFFCVLTVMNVIIAVFLDFYNVEQDRHRALVQEALVPWRKYVNFKVGEWVGLWTLVVVLVLVVLVVVVVGCCCGGADRIGSWLVCGSCRFHLAGL